MNINKIILMILLLFLFLCSTWDWKRKAIPSWLCYGGVLVMAAVGFGTKEITLAGAAGGIMLGIILLGIGQLTKGQIGEGDGIVFIATGIALGFWNNCMLLVGALFLSFLGSLILLLMKKITLKAKLPFLPFVFAAFVLEFVIRS